MGIQNRYNNVLSWASVLDDNTVEQAERTAAMPFLAGPLALMPDAHFGFGSTVGSVIPTQGAVIPSAIGVDIGCGMIAAALPFTSAALPDDLSALHAAISRSVPAGVGQGHDRQSDEWLAGFPGVPSHFTPKEEATAIEQFGSLGSGNHFVEVCLDESDRVWVVLHSGSRGIGNRRATAHIDRAKGLMKDWFIDLPDPDLAYLVEGTPDFDAYIADMLWAQDYAFGNRQLMMDAVLDDIRRLVGHDFDPEQTINCHHNFTQRENQHGKNMWVTRKGAIRARVGDLGIIPGSMATCTFIVEGLGNPASYESCSHGAGRKLSRGAAKRQLDVESLRASMVGKAWNESDAEALLDEAPDAYKDVEQVMQDQDDLVRVRHRLTQILNYKGVDRSGKRRR